MAPGSRLRRSDNHGRGRTPDLRRNDPGEIPVLFRNLQ